MGDPCKKIISDAKKRTSAFKMDKDYWSGAILYIQAADCYKASSEFEKAFYAAEKAVSLLKKYASKYGYELVINDLIRALTLQYMTAPSDKKDAIKLELFNTYNLHAQKLIQSGNYVGAADKYVKALEYAPSGDEARNMLQQAIALLEDIANKKLLQGKQKYADRLLEKIDELRMLLPAEEHAEIAGFKKSKILTTYSLSENPKIVMEEIKEELGKWNLLPENMDESSVGIEKTLRLEYDDKTSVRIRGTSNRLIVEIEGENPNSLIRYYTAIREIINNVAVNAKPIVEEFNVEITKEIFENLINDIKEKVTIGITYRDLATRLNAIKQLLIKKKDKKWSKAATLMEKLVRDVMKVEEDFLDYEILDDEIPKIIEKLDKISITIT